MKLDRSVKNTINLRTDSFLSLDSPYYLKTFSILDLFRGSLDDGPTSTSEKL